MVGQHKRRLAALKQGAQDPLSHAILNRDQKTLQIVKDALAHKQTLLAFQPVVRADAPNKAAFYEGLIRILDETGRVIPARDFMPVVEDTAMGREIDRLALEMGLQALHRNPSVRLSINMSARSIGFSHWNGTLARWLKRDSTIGERLILEITESSAMMVPELVIDFMDRLQSFGICFAMDDFGAGQTAIRYFKDFYFDILKIDGQFITGISENPDNQVLTSALVSIARHFDMLTVAEFVENQNDANTLIGLGVDCLQGYHFGAPSIKPAWSQQGRHTATG